MLEERGERIPPDIALRAEFVEGCLILSRMAVRLPGVATPDRVRLRLHVPGKRHDDLFVSGPGRIHLADL
jgi:hypothetical protein